MKHLTDTARQECLFLARKTLHEFVRRQQAAPRYEPVSAELTEPRGAFVTLKKEDHLRGCIGYIEAVKPLWETIGECTVSSASRDPRFPPVTADELPGIHIEISVLSPLQTIGHVEEIVVGEHGLLIRKGFHRGLLLPQVATEYGWNRREFLEHTCQKAGLPADAWQSGAEIRIFAADVFAEEDFGTNAKD
ncbi:MAG: AmmeMemoRadiSam system protein A [Acidobacteria bacterium]|nr:AmmeMemoRadiSam system protein A [Acidobacteriota bacterium]